MLPDPWIRAALAIALALLAESFGREVWWLWRRRDAVARRDVRRRAVGLRHHDGPGRGGGVARAGPAGPRRRAHAGGARADPRSRGWSWRRSPCCCPRPCDRDGHGVRVAARPPWSCSRCSTWASTRSSTGRSTRSTTGATSARPSASSATPSGRPGAVGRGGCGARRGRRPARPAAAGGRPADPGDVAAPARFGARRHRTGDGLGAGGRLRRPGRSGRRVASTSAAGLALRRGGAGAGRHRGPAGVRRGRSPTDRFAGHPGQPTAHRAARQGRAARLRRELRPGRRPGLDLLAPASTPCWTPGPGSCGPPGSTRAAPSSPRRPSAPPAGWRTPRSSPGCGSTASSATTSCSPATGSPSAPRSGGPAGAPCSTYPADTQDWPRGQRVLPLRPDLRRAQRRLPRPGVQLRDDAGPVHPRRVPAPRARARATPR